jgi:outer membrane protein assembly factor BamB
MKNSRKDKITMNEMNEMNNMHNHDAQFHPDEIDEQIDQLLQSGESSPQTNDRLLHGLSSILKEDQESLERIWGRFSKDQSFPSASADSELQERLATFSQRGLFAASNSSLPGRTSLRKRIGAIAAIACAIVLVGSLIAVLQTMKIQHISHGGSITNGGNITNGPVTLCGPDGKQPPSAVDYAQAAGQSGIYVANNEGITRLVMQHGQLQPVWLYKMNACYLKAPTVYPGLLNGGITSPTPLVDTSATVANAMVYFGVKDKNGIYLYALHASNGALAWRVKVAGDGGISTPLVLNNLLYFSQGNTIVALDARNASVRWKYSYAPAATDQSEGLGAVGDGKVYVTTSNTLFALDALTGKQGWSSSLDSDQILIASRFFDGIVYVTASSTCFNCQIQPASSAAYAFNPVNGARLWVSKMVAGYLSPPVESQGVVYFGSIAGNVYAASVHNGAYLWHSYVGGEVRTSPQIVGSSLYVGAGPFQSNPNDTQGYIVALTIPHGNRLWSHDMQQTYSGYEPILDGDGAIYIGLGNDISILRTSNGSLAEQYVVNHSNSLYGSLNDAPSLTLIS